MNLRNHPKMAGVWPPVWSGWYGAKTKMAYGESPEKLISVKVDGDQIVLNAINEGSHCTGFMKISDDDFREKLISFLEQNCGKSIEEVGSLGLAF